MKGIVLAGGTGSRLFRSRKSQQASGCDLRQKPMILLSDQTLWTRGHQDILLGDRGRNSGDFLRLLANGKNSDWLT